MPRAAATTDVFSAIAEPRRRDILGLLASGGAHAVGELVERLGLAQPTVSKHLGVLREAGLVEARREGQRRLYEVNGHAIRPVYDWARAFERHWDHQLDRIKSRAERAARSTRTGSTRR